MLLDWRLSYALNKILMYYCYVFNAIENTLKTFHLFELKNNATF